MGIRDLLKKKEHVEDGDGHPGSPSHPSHPYPTGRLAAPEFTFIRSDTYSEEVIEGGPVPSAHHDHDHDDGDFAGGNPPESSSRLRLSGMLRTGNRSRSASVASNQSGTSSHREKERESAGRRLSHRLHLSRAPNSSENVPEHLPEIVLPEGGDAESQWEHRATMLARENEKHRSRPGTPTRSSSAVSAVSADLARLSLHQGDASSDDGRRSASPASGMVSSKAIDEDIQQAIQLHEAGRLEESTAMFGRLADPNGSNNPLSQVLYGLALRCVLFLSLSLASTTRTACWASKAQPLSLTAP